MGPGGQKWSQRAERGQPGGLRKLPRAHGQGSARQFPIPGTPQEPPHSSRADDPQVLGVSSGGGESLKSKAPQRTKGRWLSGRVERATEGRGAPRRQIPQPLAPEDSLGSSAMGTPGGFPAGSSSPLRGPSSSSRAGTLLWMPKGTQTVPSLAPKPLPIPQQPCTPSVGMKGKPHGLPPTLEDPSPSRPSRHAALGTQGLPNRSQCA